MTISPDGSILMAGTGGSLVTNAGIWSFSAAGAGGGNVILLNGQPAANGSAVELEVANQGQLYADNAQGQWYVWNGAGWSGSSAPPGTSPPPSGLSPDGSILMAGTGGSLVTNAGIWSFSAAGAGGGNVILLNGQPAANGSAVELEVANQGQLYADNAQGQWYVWNGAGWSGSSAPPGTSPPPSGLSPDGSILMAGTGGSLVTNAGIWSFSAAGAGGGNVILLNGQPAANGSAVELEVANQGQLYADNAQGQWYVWNGAGWSGSSAPPGTSPPPSGLSPDGSILMAGTGGSLVTNAGIWSFSAAGAGGGNVILLNGQPAANGSAVELEVANQGQLYADNAQGQWYVWNGAGWSGSSAPPGTSPPPSGLSPDGSILMAGTGGSLVTNAGIWSFSAAGAGGGNVILLNGQPAANGSAVELEVANQGQLYADNAQGQWYAWNGAGWNSTSNPNSGSPPPTTTPPTTAAAFLNVAENAAATPIGIVAPTDPNGYMAGELSVTVTAVPSDGTVLLNGVAVTAGESLSVAQLTALDFAPTVGAYSQTSPLAYTVADPSGANAEGTASLTIGPATDGRVLTVGTGQQYATLAAAVAASQNGDTIKVQAGTYVNDFAQINTNVTIEGVGGMAVFEATENIPNGKAILVTDANVTINNLEFTGATVADNNGAGIRYESGDLILNNDYFYNNQEGLLSAADPSGNLLITNTEFDHNGDGSGFTHNLYIGDMNSLMIDNSYFHDAVVGHEIKSRAANTYIYNSRIDDLSGTASYSVDLPNGGNVILADNVIQQGPNSQNPTIIAYGEEGSLYAGGSLQMDGNTLVNDLTSHTPLGVWNDTGATAQLANTQINGLTPGEVAAGPVSQTGNTFLSSRPTLDTSHPWLAMT